MKTLDDVVPVLERQSSVLDKPTSLLDQHSTILEEPSVLLEEHTSELSRIDDLVRTTCQLQTSQAAMTSALTDLEAG